MRTVLAAFAIVLTGALPSSAAGPRTARAVAHHATPVGAHLTTKQKRWFGDAVEHILRGAR